MAYMRTLLFHACFLTFPSFSGPFTFGDHASTGLAPSGGRLPNGCGVGRGAVLPNPLSPSLLAYLQTIVGSKKLRVIAFACPTRNVLLSRL
ncbi:hypothetical protein F4804DRAFT_316522 [Jackrogersella minutella]|nr:hypothetical protein F4804DRAFT_316522 [Jackrogersella minutella]